MKNFFLDSKVLNRFLILGVMFLSFFIPSVYACENPIIYREVGSPINIIGGPGGSLFINGTDETRYPGLEDTYKLRIKNKNNTEVLLVTLVPSNNIKDYINGGTVYLDPGETKELPLPVWVGGLAYVSGYFTVYYVCDDGFQPQPASFGVTIKGKGIDAPPGLNCTSKEPDGCYQGIYRYYRCEGSELVHDDVCLSGCCKWWGGEEAMCSKDKKQCISIKNLPPGKEGNIAFLCKDEKCSDGIEKSIIFKLGISGWNITFNASSQFTEKELDNYDIIACTDQNRACNIDFNSLAYNQHTEKRTPFLEITDESSVKAGYGFDYVINNKGKYGKNPFFTLGDDYITQGYSGEVDVAGTNKIAIIPDGFLSGVIDLADSGNSQSSTMFRVDNSAGHGRYAYIGWMYNAPILTEDGKMILNRTLKWLKYGNAYFGGQDYNEPKKAKIALICSRDCKDDPEIKMIKFLRNDGYSVTAKTLDEWNNLDDYDIIVCMNTKGCSINPIIYDAHKNKGKSFLEIPDSTQIQAGYGFGYTISGMARKTSSKFIIPTGDNLIFSGYNLPVDVFNNDGKNYMGAIPIKQFLSVKNLATLTDLNYSVMFMSDDSGSKGRYAYVGWAHDVNSLNDMGKNVLLKIVKWLWCDDACVQEDVLFDADDLELKLTIKSPTTGKTYGNKKVLVDVETNQIVKYLYEENQGKFRLLCSDCNDYEREYTFKDGNNELRFRAVNYHDEIAEKTVNFVIDSKPPKIRGTYPRNGGYATGMTTFTVQYDEDNLKGVVLYYGNNSFIEKPLTGCPSGRGQSCSIDVDLSLFNGEIQYYFSVEDFANKESSRISRLTVDSSVPIVNAEAQVEGYRRVNLDVNVSEKVYSLEYSDNGMKYITLCKNCNYYSRSLYFSLGHHEVTIKATDIAGNQGFDTTGFNV